MILARCPHCDTTFRATADKLKAKSGKVRCGQCKKAFNALEHLIEEAPDAADGGAAGFELVPPPAPPAPDGEASTSPAAPADATPVDVIEVGDTPAPADPLLEAQTAGLVAARDTRDVPGYSKWAEGTVTAGATGFEEPRRLRWPAAVLLVVLGLTLGVQAAYLYRTEIASRWPGMRPWLEEACANLGCTVPYPADADLIDIQASELQIDPERGGLLVLHLTLQNRAEFAQAYPAIELTLTDVREQVVVRKRLAPADWLPPGPRNAAAFPARDEIASRLWIDPRDTGAVGYSLKVTY